MRIGVFKNNFSRVLIAFIIVFVLFGPVMAETMGGSEFTALETNTPDIEWSKIIGGSGTETGSDLVPTPDGGYIMLATTSSNDGDVGANFGGFDLYVEKMNADGIMEWKTVIGGSDYDAGSSITPTADGGYILLANTLSDKTLSWTGTSGSGSFGITNHGNWDMLVVKLFSDGRLSWAKTFGGSLGESDEYHASAVRQLHDGNYVIVGSTNSADWPKHLSSQKSNSTSLGVIFKISSKGTMIWSRTLGFVPEGTQAQTFFGDVVEREDGSLVAAGFTGAPGMIPADHVSTDPYVGTDGLVAQYTADGIPLNWPVSLHGENYLTFGGMNHDEFAAIEQTADAGFILVGTTKSDSHGQGDVWVVRLDKDGKAEWNKKFGGSDWDIGTGVQQVPGAYLVSGATYSHDGDVVSNPAGESFWLLRITGPDGSLQWQQTFAGPRDESYCAAAWPTADAGYIMIGSTSERNGQPGNGSAPGGQKAWIVKLTTALRKEIVNTPLSPAGADTTGRVDPGQVIPHGGRVLHYSPSPVGRPNTTIVYAPVGNNQYRAEFYAEDPEAAQYIVFPTGVRYPATIIHYVPSGSTVTSLRDYEADVLDPGTGSVTFNLTEGHWYDESANALKRSLPRGMCITGAGCSVGNSAKQHLFLSPPHPAAGDSIPVFSVRRIADNQWIGTMGTFGSSDPADAGTMIVEKPGINPLQQINFTVLGDPKSGSGLNLYVTEHAGLTSKNAVLQYSGVATSSVPLPSMELTPRIWKNETGGDVLVYTGAPQVCTNVPECRLSGTFVPLWDISNVTATYFANITTIYTMPPEIMAANPGVPGKLAMVYNPPENEPVPEVVVTGPLSPVEPGKTVSAEEANNTVPWGGTIEHVMDGTVPTTVVYDASGQPQFRADDREAEILWTPWGTSANTANVIMIPNSTYLNTTAEDVVTLQNAPSGKIAETHENILTILYRYPVQSSISSYTSKATYCSVPAPNWVEWATMSTSSLTNFYYFNTEWTIPNKPAETKVGDGTKGHERYLDSERTQVSTWNGIEGNGALIQVVPVWNGYYPGSTYTFRNFDKAWSWAIWGKDKTHDLTFLTEPASLNEGDGFDASYWISSSDATSTTWGVYGGQLGSEKLYYWKTSDLTKNNGELEVAQEAYLLKRSGTAHSTVWDAKYFPSNTKFTNFDIQTGGGEPISPAFTGCLAQEWGQNISTLKTEITSGPPYEITLHTIS